MRSKPASAASVRLAAHLVLVLALLMGCDPDEDSLPSTFCETAERELDPALLRDAGVEATGWVGFVRQQLETLVSGVESELTWHGHRSTVLVVSPDSGTTTIRIEGALAAGPIRYEQPEYSPVPCRADPPVAHLPLELRVTTEDGALDELWRIDAAAQVVEGVPREGEPPPPGLLRIAPPFPNEFSGSLTIEEVPGALDGWEGSYSFLARLRSGDHEPAMTGSMVFRRSLASGEASLSESFAEW